MKTVASAVVLAFLAASGTACEPARASAETSPRAEPLDSAQGSKVSVTVNEKGYSPNRIEAKASRPVTLVFTRTTDAGCGKEVAFPDQKIRRALPLNEPISITLTPKLNEPIKFTCGMGMYRGSIVAVQ